MAARRGTLLLLLAGCRLEGLAAVADTRDDDGETSPFPTTSSTVTSDPEGGGPGRPDASSAADEDGFTSDDTAEGPPLGETGPRPECRAPMGHTVCDDGPEIFYSLGLDCPSDGNDHTPISGDRFATSDQETWATARMYGNEAFTPREGQRLLVMTTGTLPVADEDGRIDVPFGHTRRPADQADNRNPDDQDLPAPIVVQSGSLSAPFVDCDGIGDCSETLPTAFQRAHDLIYFTFEVTVPDGTFGYEVDLAWFSAEFPRLVQQPNNDLFVWWQSSDAFTGNVATFEGAPMSATGLQPYLTAPGTGAATGNVALLQDTGFEGSTSSQCTFAWGTYSDCPNGATTGWMTLSAPVQPGETVQIVAALFDQGDRTLDTTVLIDNWRWSCGGCEPGSSCGLRPP